MLDVPLPLPVARSSDTQEARVWAGYSSGDGFFLAARILRRDWRLLLIFFFFFSGDQLAHTNCTLYARVGPQWLSGLRRMEPSVP